MDGTEEEVLPMNGTDFSLAELYKYCKTTDTNTDPMVQVVQIDIMPGKLLVCEENGEMLGLPANDVATIKLAASSIINGPRGFVGNVLIIDEDMLL